MPTSRDAAGNTYEPAPDGRGTLRFASGAVYHGEFRNGKPDGRGRHTFAGGDEYEGAFVAGKLEGPGTYRFADGRVHVLSFAAAAPVGEGAAWGANGQQAMRQQDGERVGEISLGEAMAIAARLGQLAPPVCTTGLTKPGSPKAAYTELAPLRTFLESGDVALVRASHLLELAAEGGSFARRQDVPAAALVDAPMLARCFAELAEWDEFLLKKPDRAADMRFPPLVVVSYAWSGKEHPDGDGRQLREVLAPAIEWYMAERAKILKYATGVSTPFTADGADFGVFLDFSSMYQ